MCVAVDRGMMCISCKMNYYRCSLVVVKEVPRGSSLSGLQQARAVAGSQTRGKARRGKGAKGATLSSLTLGKWE